MPEREIVDIVDEKDNVIGSKYRDELIEGDIMRVSAVYLINSKKEILLAQRSLNKKHNPGKWGHSAAGAVKSKQTYLEGANEELFEEIGVSNVKLIPIAKLRKQKFFAKHYIGFTDAKIEDFKLQQSEVMKVKWFSKKEFSELEKDKFVAEKNEILKLYDDIPVFLKLLKK